MSFIRIEGDVLSGRCLAPVYVAHPVQFANGLHLTALLDTGATHSAVSALVAQHLSLPLIGQAALHSASAGHQPISRFSAQLEFWRYGLDFNTAAYVARHFPLVGYAHPMSGIQLLIGMDILGNAKSFEIGDARWTITWDESQT